MATPNLALIPSAYKARVVYSVLPNTGAGDFTFIRSGNATRINKDGLIETVDSHVPRLNYDLYQGKPKQCPSLLLEPSSTNLIEFSEDYSQSAWLKTNLSITSNSIKSPSGVVDSAKLVPDTTNGQHKIDITETVSSGATVALSAFVKKGEYEFVCLYEVNSAKGRFYNLNDGTQGGTFGGAPTTSNIEQLPNDWYRISITTTVPSTSARFIVYVCDSIFNTSFIGDNTKGLYVWGAMLEEQSYPTSYIPTSGSTETRNAEVCNGAGNSGTFNSSEGVLFAEIKNLTSLVSSNNWLTISDGTTSNFVALVFETTEVTVGRVDVGGSNQAFFSITGDYSLNQKLAFKWKENDFSFWIDGVEVGTDSAGSVPNANTLDNLQFNYPPGGNNLYGNVKDVRVYNTALTDSQLEYLTSYRSFGDMVESQNYIIQ